MRIAQRFNAGLDGPTESVPKGRLNAAFQEQLAGRVFSRPFGTLAVRAILPRVETRGYCRLSLRDAAKRPAIYAVKNSVVHPQPFAARAGVDFSQNCPSTRMFCKTSISSDESH